MISSKSAIAQGADASGVDLMDRAIDCCWHPDWKNFMLSARGSVGWDELQRAEQGWRDVTRRCIENIVDQYKRDAAIKDRAPPWSYFRDQLRRLQAQLNEGARLLGAFAPFLSDIEHLTGVLKERHLRTRRFKSRRRASYNYILARRQQTATYRRLSRRMRKTSSAIRLVEEWCIDRPACGGRGTVSDKIWGAWRPTWILVYLCYDVFEEQGMQPPTATVGGPFEDFCYATYDLARGCHGPRIDLMRDIKSVCGQRKGDGDSDSWQRESLPDQRQQWLESLADQRQQFLELLEQIRSGELARQSERRRQKYADRASAAPQLPETTPAAPHPLERLAELADFEELRPDLAAALERFGGEKDALLPHDPVLLFKILVLRGLYGGLSCEEAERQIHDRRSFRRFLQLDDEDEVPDAGAISLFRDALRETGALELLSSRLVSLLKERGFEVEQQGQIFEPVLRQP